MTPVTPTGNETPRRQSGTPSAGCVARVDNAVNALRRSVDAARSAYEERSAQLESEVPRFAFELLESLFGRESVLAVDPGREAVARALALDETHSSGRRRVVSGRCRRHHRTHRTRALSSTDGGRRSDDRAGGRPGGDRVHHHRQPAVGSPRKGARQSLPDIPKTISDDHRARRPVRTGPAPQRGRGPTDGWTRRWACPSKSAGCRQRSATVSCSSLDYGPLQAEVVVLRGRQGSLRGPGGDHRIACRNAGDTYRPATLDPRRREPPRAPAWTASDVR